jgi:hypothetical protein
VVKFARKDVSSLYRAEVWAALLDVLCDVESRYAVIDKETATPTDRQVLVRNSFILTYD